MNVIDTIKQGWRNLWDERRVEERSLMAVCLLLVGGLVCVLGGAVAGSLPAFVLGACALLAGLGLLYIAGRGGL